jgi:hypothetical protein
MRSLAVGLFAVAILSGCSSNQWIHGKWAQLAEDGKLTGCVEFKSDGARTSPTSSAGARGSPRSCSRASGS